MHIPDGYLSPSTCAVLYGGAGVGWYAALRRVKRAVNARMVPLIAVFAAFSFLIMMFNLPLPGGTTGHALGVTIAAIVLGPSGAILALSIAIAIQALFFGDGGITTLGANCFNMAVAGSLVAYFSYRWMASGSSLTSRRRVVAGSHRRISCSERLSPACCRRVRHPAPVVPRRKRCSPLCTLCAESCATGNDGRTSRHRGCGRGVHHRRAGGVPPIRRFVPFAKYLRPRRSF